MKGTYIKVLNDLVFEELDKIRNQTIRKRGAGHGEHAEEETADETGTQK